jgi:drug/metabolite transporter (DMT)-like permease
VRRLDISAKAWLALLIVYVIWGSTYLAIRVVIRTMPPLLSAGTRWVIAGTAMYAFAIRKGDRADRPTRRHWLNAAVIGTALCLGGNGLVSIAERRITSGMAALLVATVPLFTAAFDFLRSRARIPPIVVGGLALGFGGTAVLVRPSHGAGHVDAFGALLVLAASAAWAAGSLFARRASLPERQFVATGMEMLCGGLALWVVGSLGGEISRFHPSAVSGESFLALGYLIVFGSLTAFTAYVWLLRNERTSIVTTYAYVNPLVAVILGALILNETITATTLLGGSIIVIAVAIIVSSGARAPEPVPADEQRDLSAQELPT